MRVLPVIFFILSTTRANSIHKIVEFPGAPENSNVSAYSGYLNVTKEQHQMFYLFVESHSSPSSDPLIVWLQGGPGVSSLYGAFTEIGPFIVDSLGEKPIPNRGAWNRNASLLFLESPIGVGFSLGETEELKDEESAKQHYEAIHTFITKVRPDFSNRSFYIAGESYAGVYIPFVSEKILRNINDRSFENRNFEGILIGNGFFDMHYGALHVFIKLWSSGFIIMNPTHILECMLAIERNIFTSFPRELIYVGLGAKHRMAWFNQHCYNDSSNSNDRQVMNSADVFSDDDRAKLPCHFEEALTRYFNRPEKAFHVRIEDEQFKGWTMTSDYVTKNHSRTIVSTHKYVDVIRKAEEAGLPFRILFYTGDQDLVCPILDTYRGTKEVAALADMWSVPITSYWTYRGDVAGAQYLYESRTMSLKVLSVRGAGHSVPITHPDIALQILDDFITKKPNYPVFDRPGK